MRLGAQSFLFRTLALQGLLQNCAHARGCLIEIGVRFGVKLTRLDRRGCLLDARLQSVQEVSPFLARLYEKTLGERQEGAPQQLELHIAHVERAVSIRVRHAALFSVRRTGALGIEDQAAAHAAEPVGRQSIRLQTARISAGSGRSLPGTSDVWGRR